MNGPLTDGMGIAIATAAMDADKIPKGTVLVQDIDTSFSAAYIRLAVRAEILGEMETFVYTILRTENGFALSDDDHDVLFSITYSQLARWLRRQWRALIMLAEGNLNLISAESLAVASSSKIDSLPRMLLDMSTTRIGTLIALHIRAVVERKTGEL